MNSTHRKATNIPIGFFYYGLYAEDIGLQTAMDEQLATGICVMLRVPFEERTIDIYVTFRFTTNVDRPRWWAHFCSEQRFKGLVVICRWVILSREFSVK